MTSAAATRVISVADKLLPRAMIAFGDGGVVELLGRDAFQWFGVAWR